MTQRSNKTGLFITGTDTGVGKTHVAARLIKALVNRHVPVQPRKPVESGCEIDGSDLLPADGLKLMQAAGLSDIDAITPYRFKQAVSPPRAAALTGQRLFLKQLVDCCRQHTDGYLVVEGAGGFLSPLTEDGLNADLAVALGLPVIIVVADRLGCVNHCLLTVESVRQRGLHIEAIIVNRIDGTDPEMDNLREIRRLTDIPVYADADLDSLTLKLINRNNPHQ